MKNKHLVFEAKVTDENMAYCLNGHEAELQSNIGFFMTCFAAAEMYISSILAFTLDIRDREKFHVLTRGMDARVKCERLRKAAKSHKPMGDSFEANLAKFETRSIKIRNKLSHSLPCLIDETVYFCDIDNFYAVGKLGKHTNHMLFRDLFQEGLWLNVYAQCLSNTFKSFAAEGPLELDVRSLSQQSVDHQ